MPKIQLICLCWQVTGIPWLPPDEFAIWRDQYFLQIICTMYYNWLSQLILQVGIFDEQARVFPVVRWLGVLLDFYVTILDHAGVGFLPPQHFITLILHAFAGATAFFGTQNIKNSLGNASGKSTLCHSLFMVVTNTDIEGVQPYGRPQDHTIFPPKSSKPTEGLKLTDWLLEESLLIHRASIERTGICIISSWNFISQNFYAFMVTCVETFRLCYDRLELWCSEWAFSRLQDSNLWKEAPNTHSSPHQAGKECSCCEACPSCLMPDAVNNSILESSLRFLETRRHIGNSKEALDIPSSWHPACSACFMPDAGNIPLLEGLPSHFESQKKYVQMLNGLLPPADQERQDHFASQSHVLESYFHPELFPVWVFIMLQDSNFCKEALNAHSSLRQVGKEFSWYKACLAYLMPDTVNILILTSSPRFLETRRYISIPKEASDIPSSCIRGR